MEDVAEFKCQIKLVEKKKKSKKKNITINIKLSISCYAIE